MARDVVEELAAVSGQQIDVPFECHAEARACLLLGGLTMGEEHGEVAEPRERPEDRRVVLDRMADQEADAQAHGACPTRWRSQARSSASAKARVEARAE
jgi:hypothetical protein